ncbi:MAG: DNA polymerase [Clostridium sp.]
MRTMSVDIETYSSVDIREAGVYAYAEAPDFQVMLIGYQMDDGSVEVIDLTDPVVDAEADYPDFWKGLEDQEVTKTAYNANFERTCLAAHIGRPMPPEQWRCTAVHAATLGLPGNLAGVGVALKLPQDVQKDSIGKRLIDYFCKPCKPTKTNGGRTRNLPEHAPEKWKQFVEYNRQDVIAESAIRDRLSIYQIPESEQKLWNLDQQMNDCGVRLDMAFADKIIRYDAIYKDRLMEEARRITGLDNPNSLAQLKGWINSSYHLNVTSITKDTIPLIVEELKTIEFMFDITPALRMLRIRQELGKTSVKKYVAMEKAVCPDNRLRGVLQFYGANRTGRWAGRIVQVHNLPQNKIPDLDLARELVQEEDFETIEQLFQGIPFVFSQLIRTAFIPSEGCRFVVSDFSAIEARVIAWMADETWRLEVFRTHGKIYEASASQMFHVPLESIKKGSKLRQQGKVAELALGYGGGFGAIKVMDKDGSIPDDEIPMLISNWRKASPNICKLWYNAEGAAKMAISEHRMVKLKHGLTFSYINHILFVELPSGRKLAYYDARIEKNAKDRDAITYAGVNQDTKQWGRIETWGGKLVENIVQAVARDCLADTMKRVAAAGYQIVMHVHDEIIVDVPNKDIDALKTITGLMGLSVPWAPELPLRGDGYECNFYKKD